MPYYSVYSNFPGYLPDSEPMIFEDLESAKDALRSERDDMRESEWDQPRSQRKTFRVINTLKSLTESALEFDSDLVYGSFDRHNDPYSLPIYLYIERLDTLPDGYDIDL